VPTPKKSAPRTPLTRQRVLQAAIAFADAHGLEELSMRKLGRVLGVEAMSLYKHVSNKDEILDGIIDLVVTEIELPEIGGNWKTAMRRRSISAHTVLLRHSWATLLIVSRANAGPAALRYGNASLGCLLEAGFSYPMADHAWNAIDNFVYGFTLQQLYFPFQPQQYPEVAKDFLAMLPAGEYPYLNGLAREVMDGHHDGRHDFAFGLDLILAGLDRVRKAK